MEREFKFKKRNIKTDLVLLFILGFLLGLTFKTEALKRITIGFNDYQLQNSSHAYDISAAEEEMKKEAEEAEAQGASEENAVTPGATCN